MLLTTTTTERQVILFLLRPGNSASRHVLMSDPPSSYLLPPLLLSCLYPLPQSAASTDVYCAPPPTSSSPAPSSTPGTTSTSADECEHPSSSTTVPPSSSFETKPPTGPKAWRARQHNHSLSPASSPALLARASSTPPPIFLNAHAHHQPVGFRGGRSFSPHSPHLSHHHGFLPHQSQHQFARSFNSSSRPPGPWNRGDPIVFAGGSGGARAHSVAPQRPQQYFSPPSPGFYPKHVRNASGSSALATHTISKPPTAPKKRAQKASAAANDPLVKIRDITGSVHKQLKELQVTYAKLMLQSRYRGGSDGLEACELATETLRMAELVSETARKANEAIVADQEAVKREADESEASYMAEDSLYKALDFQIPKEVMEAKLSLKDEDPDKAWLHTLYKNSSGDPVAVKYCKTIEDCERELAKYLEERVVGFDMEWLQYTSSRSIRQNVAMIQIANESTVTLCHIGQMVAPPEAANDETKLISPTLQKIIQSETILKVGVNVTNDARRLRDYVFLKPRNIFELSDLHNLVESHEKNEAKISRRLVALSRLTQLYMLLPLDKGPVRTSNWDRPLNDLQLKYAAADAYVGFRIFHVLEERRRALRPRPPLPVARIIDDLPAPIESRRLTLKEETDILMEVHGENILGVIDSSSLSPSTMTTAKKTRSKSPSGSKTSAAAKSTIPPAPEFQRAALWLEDFHKKNPDAKSNNSQLRAYALWHVFEQDLDTVCRLWRDPPLKAVTATGYIAEAIRLDKLPFNAERFRNEVYPLVFKKYLYDSLLKRAVLEGEGEEKQEREKQGEEKQDERKEEKGQLLKEEE